MDSFEQIVAGLLRKEGFWTWNGYKINLTKQNKKDIGKPSMPRPEIDILAYKVSENELLWVECKSYLDSQGVIYKSLADPVNGLASRYKVFTEEKFRTIAKEVLIEQVVIEGLVLPNPSLKFCLVTGHIANTTDRTKLHEFFSQKGWLLFDEVWLKERLDKLSISDYEDDVAVIVAKLFARITGEK